MPIPHPGAIVQKLPSPASFKVHIGMAELHPRGKDNPIVGGKRTAQGGTRKLLEQLGLSRSITPASMAQLAGAGYHEAVAIINRNPAWFDV